MDIITDERAFLNYLFTCYLNPKEKIEDIMAIHEETKKENMAYTSSSPSMTTSRESVLRELFKYHAPNERQLQAYQNLRDAALHFATVVMRNTPTGSDQATAIRKIREAVMTANAAIALEGINYF